MLHRFCSRVSPEIFRSTVSSIAWQLFFFLVRLSFSSFRVSDGYRILNLFQFNSIKLSFILVVVLNGILVCCFLNLLFIYKRSIGLVSSEIFTVSIVFILVALQFFFFFY